MIQISWLLLAVVTLVGALRAHRSLPAYRLALGALGALYLGAGAAANAAYLWLDRSYAHFADASPFAFVRDTWESLVVPHETFFITLLVVFEATVGVLVLVGGRGRRVALVLIAAFDVALLAFSLWYLAWSVPMVVAMVLLLKADRQWTPEVSQGPSSNRSAGPAATARG
jgi:hypothetical protein